jgi:outer membrane lipoprotein SlyB
MTYPSRLVTFASSAVMLASLMACAPMSPAPTATSSTAPVYNTAPSPQGAYTEYGRVTNVEVVKVQAPASAGPGIGAVLGGVAGAVVGSQIGAGNGRTAAIVLGAVGGAVAGNSIERSRTANVAAGESYRVSVRLDNGAMQAFDVASYGELRIGDRVRIENGQLYRVL